MRRTIGHIRCLRGIIDPLRHNCKNACGLNGKECCKMVAGTLFRLGWVQSMLIQENYCYKYLKINTNLFASFQPSSTRTLFQYFTFLFAILTTFPWRLVLLFVIHLSSRHINYSLHNSQVQINTGRAFGHSLTYAPEFPISSK